MQAVASISRNAALVAVSAVLFAFLGPLLPLPCLPHIKILDAREDLLSGPSKPLQGPLSPNTILQSATVLFNNTLLSSESVEVLHDGSLLLLDKYGYVHKAVQDGSAPGGYALEGEPLAHLGPGRPLGFKMDRDGDVIICNAGLGLIKLQLPGAGTAKGTRAKVELLGSMVTPDSPIDPSTPILYPNDLDISQDGQVIYFTDSQAVPVLPNWGRTRRPWYDTFQSYLHGVYAAQASGRLMAYFPNNGSIHVLVKGFFFPNGVALSEDGTYLAIAETNKFRVLRYWLQGAKAGTLDILVDSLPGQPDGVNTALGGKGFWVALPAARTAPFDAALKYRGLRVLVAYLPPALRPKIPLWGAAVLVTPEGEITRFLQDPTGKHVAALSDVVEEPRPGGGSRLFFGSVSRHYIAYLDTE